jgi:NAD(P)-dependent dehydrogenase (short-subunit alcohol dehydrogenase family)
MKLKGSVALVTGANRGRGAAFARALVEARAKKVYAAARNPGSVTTPGVSPLRLDVTHSELRQELQGQGAELLAVHAFIDADLARGAPGPKTSPRVYPGARS